MKKALIVLGLAFCGMVASADVLLWQVSDPATQSGTIAVGDYAYAAIYDTETKTYLKNYAVASPTAEGVELVKVTDGATGQMYAALGDSYSSKSFYIELFDASYNSVFQSDTMSALQLADSIADFSNNFSTMNSSKTTWTGGAYKASPVPEPTSGMLLLVGAALLSLRRRKRA